MNLKWPKDYQQRIETIIGAEFDENLQAHFLDAEVRTPKEAKDLIARLKLIQRGLRQVRSELREEIKSLQQRAKLEQSLIRLLGGNSYRDSGMNISQEVNEYQNVIDTLSGLLMACERRKIDLELWIGQQRLVVGNKSPYRQSIPDDVQMFVWNRDGGKCVKCGSQENLEFDHIIPVSKGGSNTARNIQLLCEACNRAKSNSIGGG